MVAYASSELMFGVSRVTVVAVALVLLRVFVYLRFEQLQFDSDQAIIGLMAEHLVNGRAFPLFFYGQTYLLGVEAWAAAPFFLIAGPTVLALRLSILAWNLTAAMLLLKALEQGAGLRSWAALVPALFFIAAPPSIAAALMTAQGAIIEPFVYVTALWFLRNRPMWFGAVLALGTLNREFTFYAVPALLLVELLTGKLGTARRREWLLAMVAFLVVWESVEALKPYADLMGPGTRGQLIRGYGGSQVANLVGRFQWNVAELPLRISNLGSGILAFFSGATQVETQLPIPSRSWLGWTVGLALMLGLMRTVWILLGLSPSDRGSPAHSLLQRMRAQVARVEFAVYAMAVGGAAVVAFISAKPALVGYSRYTLLGLLMPVGLTAIIVSLDPNRFVRRTTMVVMVAWAALMTVDHTRLILALERKPPPNPMRQLADYLMAQGISTAAGGYWRAYNATFLTAERVRIASVDVIRITEYQNLLPEHPVTISDRPCGQGAGEGEQVGGMYVCRP